MALTLAMILNRRMPGLVFFRAGILPAIIDGRQRGGCDSLAAHLWLRWCGQPVARVPRRPNEPSRLVGCRTPTTTCSPLFSCSSGPSAPPMIIFLAGLKQIPQELYEAAAIGRGIATPYIPPHHTSPADAYHLLQSDHADQFCVPGLHTWLLLSAAGQRAGHSTPFSSTHCICISWVLWSSEWDMRRPWPGCCLSLSLCSPHLPSSHPASGSITQSKETSTWMRDSRLRTAILLLLVTGGLLVTLFPLWWLLVSSFSPEKVIFKQSGIWPTEFTLNNYLTGWKGATRVTFGTYFLNSFVVVGLRMIGTVASSAMTGYALRPARIQRQEDHVRDHAAAHDAAVPRNVDSATTSCSTRSAGSIHTSH